MRSAGPAPPPATIFGSNPARGSSGSWRAISTDPPSQCFSQSLSFPAPRSGLPCSSLLRIPVQAASTCGRHVRIVLLSSWQWEIYIGAIGEAAVDPGTGWKHRFRVAAILPNQPPHITQSMSGGVKPERALREQLIDRIIDIAGGGQRIQLDQSAEVVQSLSHRRVGTSLKLALGYNELGFGVIRQGNRGIESRVLAGKPTLGVVV